MSRLEQLPPDQHAVLSLLVRQGRTYEQVARMLGIEESAVRARAQRALSTLGDAGPIGLTVPGSERIGDYLLGQLSDAARIETLAQLTDEPAARAWARTVADELGSLATVPLPAVPEEPSAWDEEPSAWAEEPPWAEEEPPAPGDEADERAAASEQPGAVANRGGGVLLIAAVLALAAVVVFIVHGGGTTLVAGGPIPASAATQTNPTSTSNSGVVAELSLKPTTPGSRAAGAAAIIRSGSSLQIAFSASHLPPPGSGHYVLWLYDSPAHFEALGEVQSVKADGSVAPLATALPSDASSYHGVALTLDTSNSPSSPGPVVLAGTSTSPL
jgi:hypothetical protein